MGTVFSSLWKGISNVFEKLGRIKGIWCANNSTSFFCSCYGTGINNNIKCVMLSFLKIILCLVGFGLILKFPGQLIEGLKWIGSSFVSFLSFVSSFTTSFELFTNTLIGWINMAHQWISNTITKVGLSLDVSPYLIKSTVTVSFLVSLTSVLANSFIAYKDIDSQMVHNVYEFLDYPLNWIEQEVKSISFILYCATRFFFFPAHMIIYLLSFLIGNLLDFI